jgi:hypothetical protein
MSTAALNPSTDNAVATFDIARQRQIIRRELARRSFCTIATASSAHFPHVAGVLYTLVGDDLYVTMHDDSAKARNLAANPRVAICVPVRKIPIGPPFAIQFQGRATVFSATDPEIASLLETNALKKITTSIDLTDPRNCFVRISPNRRVSSYGLGVPLLQVMRDPVSAMRTIAWRTDTTG